MRDLFFLTRRYRARFCLRTHRQRCSAAKVSSKDDVKRECRSSISSSRKVRSSERYSRRRVTERFDDEMLPPSKVPTNLTLRQSATPCALIALKISSSGTVRFTRRERSRTTDGYRGKGEYWMTFTRPLRSADRSNSIA